MISVNNFAKVMSMLTFFLLFFVLLNDGKIMSFIIFSLIFLCGLLIRKKSFFWKACTAFFGILSIVYAFRLFGGLEPNSAGVIAGKKFFSAEILLFVMLVFSFAASVSAGMRAR